MVNQLLVNILSHIASWLEVLKNDNRASVLLSRLDLVDLRGLPVLPVVVLMLLLLFMMMPIAAGSRIARRPAAVRCHDCRLPAGL